MLECQTQSCRDGLCHPANEPSRTMHALEQICWRCKLVRFSACVMSVGGADSRARLLQLTLRLLVPG